MPKKSQKRIREKRSFSSLRPKDRFLAYVMITLIIGAILVFAISIGIIIQGKNQTSGNFSEQSSSPATVPSNPGPATTGNAENDASTNPLAPLTESIISDTNSN
jgi:hypothetical protein